MNKIENTVKFYYDAIKLKEKIRSGWNWENWNVLVRRESVADHVYGTQMLALAIYSNFNVNIDIYKVNMMLALHETEEIRMPDFTPFSKISNEERKRMGEKSVKQTCKSLVKNNFVIDLINEFNERTTNEARFAYYCDKLECDLQAKLYSDNRFCTIEEANQEMLKDERIQEIIEAGFDTVADIFIEYDRSKFGDTVFKFILDYVQNINVNDI